MPADAPETTPSPPTTKGHAARPATHSAAGPATQPASLWPHSTQAGELPSTRFALSRFDPLADEQALADARFVASFDVCHPALALRALLLVQIVLGLGALIAAPGWPVFVAAAASGVFAGVLATLVWLVAVCFAKPLLRRLGSPGRLASVLSFGAVAAWLGCLPLAALGVSAPAASSQLVGVGLSGAAIAALLWAWLGLRARIWQPAQTHARLVELQSRIRPHFLFNALNTALALVRVDPERAEGVLEDLSALFRTALADSGISVSLQEEIELAQRYLAIEQVRFGARLKVRWDVDARVGSARVPPLVLQPLVENAVRHGIEPATRGGRVAIEAKVQRGQAVVVVSNTLSDEPSEPGHGMALGNVRERLRLLHDLAGQVDTWREGDFFHARIIVPLS